VEDVIAAVLAVASCAACGRIGFDSRRDEALADAADTGSVRCDPGAPFGAPVRIDELASTAREGGLRLMPDELSGYVASDRDGAPSVYLVTRSDRDAPFALEPAPALGMAAQPALAADGTFILFERSGDIWIAARTAATAFGAIGIATDLSSGQRDADPFVQATGDDIYLASTRDSGDAANGDLYHALRVGSSFVVPSRIAELASSFDDGAPVIAADGLALYFRSNRPSAHGGTNIYVARRADVDTAWQTPELVEGVSSDANDEPSWLSGDGCRLYLTSDRSGAGDVFVATRR
jgi:Tol biopolymer transport system component